MIISTFELLVKPQLPKDSQLPGDIPTGVKEKIGRLGVQLFKDTS